MFSSIYLDGRFLQGVLKETVEKKHILMAPLFKCTTKEGYKLKVLVEILHNSFKNISLAVDEVGVSSQVSDNKNTLIQFQLFAENFSEWVFTQKMLFGINLTLFHKAVSSIKKKDTVTMEVVDTHPNVLRIAVIPNNRDHVDLTTIAITQVQAVNFDVPTDYENPILIDSSKIQKIFKDINNTGKNVSVIGNRHFFRIVSETPNVINKNVLFGTLQDEHNVHTYSFDSDKLVKISKIASLHRNLKVYLDRNLPFVIKANVGDLGTISIFIKSNQVKI
jgi:hypothetical protein